MSTSECRTLVEFYDSRSMCNIVGPLSFRPERVIYLVGKAFPGTRERDCLKQFVKSHCPETSVMFSVCDTEDSTAVIEKLKKLQKVCGALTVELTGGGEAAAFACGLFIHCRAGSSSSVVRYGFADGKYSFLTKDGKKSDEYFYPEIRLDVKELFAAAGGEVTGFARTKPEDFTPELCSVIMKVWKIFVRHCDEWSRFASYLQYGVRKYGDENSLTVTLPDEIEINAHEKRSCPPGILTELNRCGAIYGYHKSDDTHEFTFRNEHIRYFLMDAGMWLELYCRLTAMKTADGTYYDDFAQSVLVRWGNGDRKAKTAETTNEIDCVVTRGIRSVFISCKLSEPQVSALNEIKTLTERFGGMCSHAMLVTMAKLSESSHIVARARELGITLVGRETLVSGKLGSVIRNTIEK